MHTYMRKVKYVFLIIGIAIINKHKSLPLTYTRSGKPAAGPTSGPTAFFSRKRGELKVKSCPSTTVGLCSPNVRTATNADSVPSGSEYAKCYLAPLNKVLYTAIAYFDQAVNEHRQTFLNRLGQLMVKASLARYPPVVYRPCFPSG